MIISGHFDRHGYEVRKYQGKQHKQYEILVLVDNPVKRWWGNCAACQVAYDKELVKVGKRHAGPIGHRWTP